jgi:predicted nucleic acid-binding protein
VPLPPSPIGFDASVLINFCEADALGVVVRTVPPPRMVLRDVLEELESGTCRRQVEQAIERGDFEVAEVDASELGKWAEYTLRLDPGESATLAVAASRSWSVAMDERAARRLAEKDVGRDRLTGTVGILRVAVDEDIVTIDEGNELLRRMIDAGYWSPIDQLGDEV